MPNDKDLNMKPDAELPPSDVDFQSGIRPIDKERLAQKQGKQANGLPLEADAKLDEKQQRRDGADAEIEDRTR